MLLINNIKELNKMKKIAVCQLCNEEIYSGLGQGCKMCGMPLESSQEFCSEKCEIKYRVINNIKELIQSEKIKIKY